MHESSPADERVESFADVVGHPANLKALQTAFDQGRAHHAYLFTGPPGIGKRQVARVLARSLLCRQGRIGYPCNRCADCVRIRARTHPDWFEMQTEPAAIKIDDIRRLNREWSYRSFEGGYRCALLDDAERMTPEAANALLKILEEPPARSFFFLIAPNRAQLLPTVVSRCQPMHFTPLSTDQVEVVLSRLQVSIEELQAAALFSGGSPGKALALANDAAFRDHRALFAEFLDLTHSEDIAILQFGAWAQRGGERTRAGTSKLAVQRDHTANILEMLKFLLRDMCLLKAGGSADRLVNRHLASALVEPVHELTWGRLSAILEVLNEAELALNGNVTPRLVLENLASRVARPW